MSELKPCPFHNCLTCACVDEVDMSVKDWNTRPIEDDLRKRIAELEAERRWRIIADGEMPEDRATVLVAFKNREILTATYYKRYEGFGGVENYWHIEGWHSGNVTHWMPLPEPPEERER